MYFKRWQGICLSLTLSICAYAQERRVAVIDSGLDKETASKIRVCSDGGFDFQTLKREVITDDYGHGSLISKLINNDAPNSCIMMYKVSINRQIISDNIAIAIALAIKDKAEAINISLAGTSAMTREKVVLALAKEKGIQVFISAGNKNTLGRTVDLDKECVIYPACYFYGDSVIQTVGAWTADKMRASYSNYGSKLIWDYGDYEDQMGTSFSTARATANYIRNKK